MQTIILLLALKGTTVFTSTDVVCKEITNTWQSGTQIGIRYRIEDYVTQFKTDDELRTQLHTYCPKHF